VKCPILYFISHIKLSVGQNSDVIESILDDEIFRRMNELDGALRELELDGRLLEERIRSGQRIKLQ